MAIEQKESQFEQIIQTEISGMDLDALCGMDEASEKVSEVVGESGKEAPSSGGKKQKTQKRGLKNISDIIFGLINAGKSVSLKHLPSPQVQKRETKKAIIKRTRKLIAEATRLQNSQKFSAHKLEQIVYEIRYLQNLLAKMFSYTAEKIEALYRKYVLK